MPKVINIELFKTVEKVAKTIISLFPCDNDQHLNASLYGIAAGVTIAKAHLQTVKCEKDFAEEKKIIRRAIIGQLTTFNELEYRSK